MIWLLVAGRPLKDVAAVTGYSERWVRAVVRRYNDAGPESVADQRHRNAGAAPLLDPAGRVALEDALAQPPEDGGRWTGRKVAAWIARHTGRARVVPQRGWDYLRRLDFSPRVPRPRHTQAADAAAQTAFQKTSPEQLKKSAPVCPVAKSRCGPLTSTVPACRRCCGGSGRSGASGPVQPRYEWLYLYGFVHPGSGAVEWFLCHTVNLALFAAVLQRFAQAVGAGKDKLVILVLDGAGWHAPERLDLPEGLRLVFLPPYTPELPPAEPLWPLVREAVANKTFASLATLDQALAERCLALTKQPDTIKANTRFHWWPNAA